MWLIEQLTITYICICSQIIEFVNDFLSWAFVEIFKLLQTFNIWARQQAYLSKVPLISVKCNLLHEENTCSSNIIYI